MLFNEIHSRYFAIASEIIKAAQEGTLDRGKLEQIVRKKGFAESNLEILDAIAHGDWPIDDKNWSTPIKAVPTKPLRLVEKQWLKALLLDPRIKLFDVDRAWLDDIEPLYTPDTVVYFDQYLDGDPFEDEHYITVFRTLLTAIKTQKKVRVTLNENGGTAQRMYGSPKNLEYSLKDDKFRLRVKQIDKRGKERPDCSINLKKIIECEITDEDADDKQNVNPENQELVFEMTDERNAMERVLLHFSHFEKEVEKLEESYYRVKLIYRKEDATELTIRLLSFGPLIKVVSPQKVVDMMRERILRQMEYEPQ